MNTLKIQIPEGFKVESFDETSGTVTLAPLPKDIRERIKTFADVLSYHGISAQIFAQNCDQLTKDEKAYRQIKLIVDALNEGWTPDWENGEWDKYFPWFTMGSSSSGRFSFDYSGNRISLSTCGSRLCFKSRELAEYAGKQFIEIYKYFLTLK